MRAPKISVLDRVMNRPPLAFSVLKGLSDDVLLTRLTEIIARGRRVEVEIVAHIAEVDARRLYLGQACSSMHAYATERLRLSNAEAYLRITVARLSRRFPVVLAMLADGRAHLSGLVRLAPHLSEQNAADILRRASSLPKREIELLVAEIAPVPDAPSRIRRLPTAVSTRPPAALAAAAPATDAAALAVAAPATAAPATDATALAVAAPASALAAAAPAAAGTAELGPDRATSAMAPSSSSTCPASVVPAVESQDGCSPRTSGRRDSPLAPLSPGRFKVQFTAGPELHGKIVHARALLRREIPDGDLAAIVDRAMTLLVREIERARSGATAAPRRSSADADPSPSSRRIPDPIRRAVWARDGGQCTFRDRQRRRCSARERLELHHVIPFARGGDHSEGNLRIVCAAHNAHQASLDYGAAFMAARRDRPRAGERPPQRWSTYTSSSFRNE